VFGCAVWKAVAVLMPVNLIARQIGPQLEPMDAGELAALPTERHFPNRRAVEDVGQFNPHPEAVLVQHNGLRGEALADLESVGVEASETVRTQDRLPRAAQQLKIAVVGVEVHVTNGQLNVALTGSDPIATPVLATHLPKPA
jgi:ribosomal protein S16